MSANSALDLRANFPLTTGPLALNGSVTVSITSGVSLTSPGTYVLLNHGTLTGGGSFKLILPPGLQTRCISRVTATGSGTTLMT